jgi:uncharacterized protein (DUF885 family)
MSEVDALAMRAGRLVVDTGLHAKGWSRQQAVDHLVENNPLGVARMESEVDRYLAEQGQALALLEEIVEEWIAGA